MSRLNGQRCFYCPAILVPYACAHGAVPADNAATFDHIVPRRIIRIMTTALTPRWSKSNKVHCCVRCNTLKGDMSPLLWLALLEWQPAINRLASRLLRLGFDPEAVALAQRMNRYQPVTLSSLSRDHIAAKVESLVDMLDVMDGDPDIEDEGNEGLIGTQAPVGLPSPRDAETSAQRCELVGSERSERGLYETLPAACSMTPCWRRTISLTRFGAAIPAIVASGSSPVV
jgi:hypothetical protein